MLPNPTPSSRFRLFRAEHLDKLPQLAVLPREELTAMRAVAHVLPFAVNAYVVDELIDWSSVPDDPLFQLTFPQREMLAPEDFDRMYALVESGAPRDEIQAAAREIQRGLNPHPAGQASLNVPTLDGRPLRGVQHKYRETALFFPSRGQTCLSYCTYCFRWPQFVGLADQKFAASESTELIEYMRRRSGITDVLVTGGDPLVMRTSLLRAYLEPLLAAKLPDLRTIRIGTKAPAFWPQRFVTDPDADDLLRLFERIVASGLHLAVMAHYSHPRELETEVARTALKRILATGAVVRCQSPLIRRVNDSARTWARMWRRQVQLGAVPYYMFVERDTGARSYFEVPLERAWHVFRDASSSVSGLARTARGPSMSATPGKVVIDGVTSVGHERVFALRLLQAREPGWVGRPFFARFDPSATWFDQLRPALGSEEFFFEPDLRRIEENARWREMLRPRSSMLGAPRALAADTEPLSA
jgi:KamA family protein